MVDVTKIFNADDLREWKETVVAWEAKGDIRDPEDYEEWVEDLEGAFKRELRGQSLDEETVRYWRDELKDETKAYRKQYLKEKAEEEKAQKKRDATREKFFELRAQGLTVSEIGTKLKVEAPELLDIISEADWSEFRKLENAQRIRIDDLRATNGIKKERRIETLGKHYNKILAEIETRDFKDIATERLLDYALKYSQLLKDEDGSLSLELHHGKWGSVETYTI